jgi:hypothetical protein
LAAGARRVESAGAGLRSPTFGGAPYRRWRGNVQRRLEAIVDSPWASLWYHPRSKIVHHQFKRYARGDEFRSILEKGRELVIKYGAAKWLSDDRANGPLTPADADWVGQHWAPAMLRTRWRFWSVVLPAKVPGQMYMRRRMEAYAKQGVVSRAFTSPEAALAWLENPTERWTMYFWHEPVQDVITMTFQDCVVETAEEATDFMCVVFLHIQRHRTPADVLIDYGGLTIKPQAAHQFGLERAEFRRRFVRRSFRFNVGMNSSRTAIYTSAVLTGAETNIYPTREDALAALLAERRERPLPGDPDLVHR